MTNKNKGFTIVETLVAITVLVLAISGATTALQTGVSSYVYAKNQVIAFYLAQEGFEQIRNIRDQNALQNQNWLTGIAAVGTDPCYFGSTCRVDAVPGTLTRCVGSCPYIQQSTSGAYGHTSGPNTVFRRTISLASVSANEIAITVTVDWSKGPINRQFRARENLLNWPQ